jgi:hypothetical protein
VIDELGGIFIPRFAALARERLQRAMQIAIDRQHEKVGAVTHELHAMAGEAGLLGLEDVMGAAREAEAAARLFGGSAVEPDASALLDCLKRLEHVVDEAVKRASTE